MQLKTIGCMVSLPLMLILTSAARAGELGESATLNAVYTGDIWHNQHGGLKTGSAYLDNLDVMLDVDTEKLLGWQGGRWFAYALYNNGASFSATKVGDAQVVSNIETVRALRLYEFWYEQSFHGGDESLRVGLYDLNSEFYATDSSALFLNASHGIGPDFSQTGQGGPSIFPNTSLAARWQQNFASTFSGRIALLDAVPGEPDHPSRTVVRLRGDEGLLAAAELDFHPGSYRVGLGSWRYNRRQPRLDETGDGISSGSYGFVEYAVVGEMLETAAVRGFLRFGKATDRVNRLSNFVGAGLSLRGASWGREGDEFGVAVARAENGTPYRDLLQADDVATDANETNIEMTYRFSVNERLHLQPDLQYIMNPDTDPSLKNALVLGIRFELALY